MGTCISSRNSIRVSDMSSSVTKDDVSSSVTDDQPQNKAKPIEVLMENGGNEKYISKYPPCNTMSDESSGSHEKCEGLGQEVQNDLSATYESFIGNLNENSEIDSIVKMRLKEFISESSDSDSSSLEDGNMLWIPFSMAQHMGVTSVTRGLDTRDRIYANDEELFMSVETSRRSSHLTTLSLPLSSKPVKSRPVHSFVTNLTHTNIQQNINNNHFPTDDSSEVKDAEIQNFDDNWISIKIDRISSS